MKSIIKLIFLLSLLFLISSFSGKDDEKAIINVTLADSLATENQWVYLYKGIGNEAYLSDSVFIKKGQTRFTLKTTVEEPDMYSWIFFSKKGHSQARLQLNKKDKIELNITDNKLFPYSTGSQGMMEKYIFIEKSKKRYNQYLKLKDLYIVEKNEKAKKIISDSLVYYDSYFKIYRWLDYLKIAKNALNYYNGYVSISNLISPELSDSIMREMKRKFPDNKEIQLYPETIKYPPATEKGRQIEQRWVNMMNEKDHIPQRSKEEKTTERWDTISVASYNIGDTVQNIHLEDINGNFVSLYDIKTDYVLIDFWASWCGPCRNEIRNYMTKKYDLYKDKFSIYAITIDKNDSGWKDAVKFDKSDMFTQVTINSNPEGNKIKKLFNVQAIPTNYLLDKNHKIVAKDLRGENLYLKVKELTLEK